MRHHYNRYAPARIEGKPLHLVQVMHRPTRERRLERHTVVTDDLHLHAAQVDQGEWVREFSQYDAGWLHAFASRNHGDLRRADWDDLNYPARLTTLVAAGVPLLRRDNGGSVVATQSLADERGIGLFFSDVPDLARQLRDRARRAEVREDVWSQRYDFTFDAHADALVDFFRRVLATSRRP